MSNNCPNQDQGWVLMLAAVSRHYFVGHSSLCGLYHAAIAPTDYEERNDGRVPNCLVCEDELDLLGSKPSQELERIL